MLSIRSHRLSQLCKAACLNLGSPGAGAQHMYTTYESMLPGLVHDPLQQFFGPANAWRSVHASAASLKALEVKIQSMGESISEGTVAAILKRPGDHVEEDEPILQIETDKVTIDVRAPEAGKLENLLVKADDTVTTGQLVATVAAGQEGSSVGQSGHEAQPQEQSHKEKTASPAEQPPASSQQQQQQQPAEETGQTHHRRPGISFPRRRLPDGTRISDLPFEQQQQHLKEASEPREQQQQHSRPQSGSSKPDPPQRKHVLWYVGKEEGTKLSQSRVLSDREMEQIELGGA